MRGVEFCRQSAPFATIEFRCTSSVGGKEDNARRVMEKEILLGGKVGRKILIS
jgi:hypothetical protein